jgi:hypothetical protein
MNFKEPKAKSRSLGKLRPAEKRKPPSPCMIGTLRLQRHTAEAILKHFEACDDDDVPCNIAGWVNEDYQGQYLTVEISPKFQSRLQQSHNDGRLAFIFREDEDRT